MKKSLRASAFICAVILLSAVLCACGNGDKTLSAADLRARGMVTVGLMSEMAESEVYRDIYSFGDTYDDLFEQICAGDYTEPEAVFRVTPDMSEPTWLGICNLSSEDYALLSDNLKNTVKRQALSSIITLINKDAGNEALVVTSMLVATDSFACTEPENDMFYIYTFSSGQPIAVLFARSNDGLYVGATGRFIMGDAGDYDTVGEIKAMFDRIQIGCTVDEVK